MRSTHSVAVVLLSIGVLVGCGAETPERPRTTPTGGVITYKGQPVKDASVSFVPDVPASEAARHVGAFGVTDAEGNFTLMTYKSGDGAVPGKYKVTVSKRESLVKKPEPETGADDYVDPGGGTAPPPPKSVLPSKYSSPDTTDLVVTVPEGDGVEFEFELKN